MEPAKKGGEAAGQRKVLRDVGKFQGNNPEECPICFTAFGGATRRPRTLPCGHTFCTSCINGLNDQSQVTCPTCRVGHALPEAGNFPVSYITEDLIWRLRDASLDSPPPKAGKDTEEAARSNVTERSNKSITSLSSKIRSLLQEQEEKVLAAIRSCHEVQGQMIQYKTTLAGWCDQQQELQGKLQALMDKGRDTIVLVRQEESQVAAKEEQVQQGEKELQAVLQALRTATTRQQAYDAIDDADLITNEERERTEEQQRIMPDVYTVTTIRKVMMVSRAALKAAEAVEGALNTEGYPGGAEGGSCLLSNPSSTVTEKLQNLVAPTLEVEDLRSLLQPVRSLLEAGRVFAVHEVKGHNRHAKIRFEGGRLYLHSLQNQTPPLDATIVQVIDVVPPFFPCLVFLDLVWPGTKPRRVLVRLTPDTPLGRQFMLLCTGQRGPCYANTKFFHVVQKGKSGEWVAGGDYEKNDGTGGAALLPDLNKSENRKSGRAGAVFRIWRCGNSADWNARFGISTRDKQEDDVFVSVFGMVEEGLDAVVAAAQYRPINKVTVADCGVVL